KKEGVDAFVKYIFIDQGFFEERRRGWRRSGRANGELYRHGDSLELECALVSSLSPLGQAAVSELEKQGFPFSAWLEIFDFSLLPSCKTGSFSRNRRSSSGRGDRIETEAFVKGWTNERETA